jgi:aminomethyltransferase
VAVRRYGPNLADEVLVVVHRAGLFDLSPPSRIDVAGTDGARLLSRVCTRNVERLPVDRVAPTLLLDERGLVLDEGTVAHLDDGRYRLTTDGRWLGWLLRHARGLDVHVDDVTDRTGVLAVEGSLAAVVLGRLAPSAIHVEEGGLREIEIGGKRALLARVSVGPDPGFQLTVQAGDAVRLWDTLLDAGQSHGLAPVGFDALDVLRVEAGRLRRGVDFVGARDGASRRTATPGELDLGDRVDLEREVRFVGQDHVEREARDGGPETGMAGLAVDERDLARVRGLDVLLPPPEDGVSRFDPAPVYAADGASQVGFAGSFVYAPAERRHVALARVPRELSEPGSELRLEEPVDGERRSVAATVVPLPFRRRPPPFPVLEAAT